jgi:hypothetical protein
MHWLTNKKEITPSVTGNWRVIPEDWYNKAKEKDFSLLFPAN